MDIFSDSSLQYETYVKSHTFTIKLQTVTQTDYVGLLCKLLADVFIVRITTLLRQSFNASVLYREVQLAVHIYICFAVWC